MISFVPRSFLYFLPLHIGAEVILGIGVFNKASGIYGFLSLFTGHPISVMEWLLNLISIALLPLYVMAFLNISKKNALRTLLFSYLYCADTLLGIAFTVYFAVHWFTNASAAAHDAATGAASTGFTSVVESLSSTGLSSEVVSDAITTVSSSITVASTTVSSQVLSTTAAVTESIVDAVTGSLDDEMVDRIRALAARASVDASGVVMNKAASLAQETSVTIVITVALQMIKIYFSFVMVGYARMLVRQHNLRSHNGEPKGSWSAKLQYWAVSVNEPFWTGNPSSMSSARAGLDDKEDEVRLNGDFNKTDE